MRCYAKLCLIILFFISSAPQSSEISEISEIREIADSLQNYSLSRMQRVNVENYRIDLIKGELFLENGELYLTGYVNGKPTTAYFYGNGQFYFYPPNPIETQQLNKFYKTDRLTLDFSQILLVTPMIEKILKSLKYDIYPSRPRSRIKRQFREIRNIPRRKFKYDLPLQIARAMVEGKSDFLWLDIQKGRFSHTVYLNNPYDVEQVSLYKLSAGFRNPQLVSSFSNDKELSKLSKDNQYDLFEYDIDIDISTYGKSNINCNMFIEVKDDSLKTIQLGFPREYKVDKVTGFVADSISYYKRKRFPGLTIELDKFYFRGDTINVGVEYKTYLFYHFMNGGVIQDRLTHWYPYHGFRMLSDYNIKYNIEKGYGFISVGDRIVDSTDGTQKIYEYKTENPTAYISFNFGLFDTLTITDSDSPIRIYSLTKQYKSKIFTSPVINEVADDVKGSFDFYNDKIAPYAFKHLDVASMSVPFGQGSPGFVHLPTYTFLKTSPGIDDKLRAHEVAHQWWGHLIHPATYHDIWLSEGFAEYSAALYIEKVKNDKRLFSNILKKWRELIVKKGGWGRRRSIGFRSGSITLGWRLGSENTRPDYENIVYCKGAYLLHMLRYKLELESGDPDIFFDLLSDFAGSYSNQMTTSEDFIKTTRKYLGESTESFFNQWLYGWQVPRIKKQKKIRRDGSSVIILTVSEIPDNFETLYPVYYLYKNNTAKTVIYNLKAGENIFEFIPESSLKIDEIFFNPYYDILEQ